jgi:hypothetical protein
LQKGKTCNCHSTVINSAVINSALINTFKFLKFLFSKRLLSKPLLFKKGSVISTQASRPSRYFLPLPFW